MKYIIHTHTHTVAGAQNHDPPSLQELITFRGRERTINIPQEIGVHYVTFGTLLLENYKRVQAIEREHTKNAERINMEILQEWVEGRGKQPVTWDTLVDILRDTQLTELAIEIASAKAVCTIRIRSEFSSALM